MLHTSPGGFQYSMKLQGQVRLIACLILVQVHPRAQPQGLQSFEELLIKGIRGSLYRTGLSLKRKRNWGTGKREFEPGISKLA
jgi:hypothetical protein